MSLSAPQIRDAATVILLRRDGPVPRVLMGQRGQAAAFMPGKFVFPGGAVDAEDFSAAVCGTVSQRCLERLRQDCKDGLECALAAAAMRELREETGLVMEEDAPLWFVFRAITPPDYPRRFDARFFLAEATSVRGDPDDFSQAEDELAHIQWLTLEQVRDYDVPSITRIALAQVERLLDASPPPPDVTFFDHRSAVGEVRVIP